MNLSLVLHAHQPPGNFDSVFEHGMKTCYGPVLDLIEERRVLRLSMHWSGPLLEWMEIHTPERIDQIRRLVEGGQVELVAAGMYEPVLSLLPRRDRVGQLRAHRAYLARRFGVDATVGWLTERVWEPSLVSDLVEGGIAAVTLDDRHFMSAGLAESDLGAPYLTEHQGAPMLVAPGGNDMRAAIPWASVDEALNVIKRRAEAGTSILVYGDDTEKFGMWPGTYRSVIRSGWLAQFFDGLLALPDDIDVVPLGEAVERSQVAGRVYIPDGSYPEMLEWTLTAAAQRSLSQIRGALSEVGLLDTVNPHMRSGLYFQFLAKYPEVNLLHKRMLDVSRRCERLLRGTRSWDPDDLPEAVRELWRAQANCAYWHGMFGGIYLPHIRQRLWYHLLRAEDALERERGPERMLRRFDLDADGEDEVVVTTPDLVVVVDPSDGAVVELSHRPSSTNLGDTLALREESYHDPEDPPYPYDRGRRGIFVDRFLASGRPPARSTLVEDRGEFSGLPYAVKSRKRGDTVEVQLEREAAATEGTAAIRKTIEVRSDAAEITATYRVTSMDGTVEGRFAVELNLAMLFRERARGSVRIANRDFALPRGGATKGAESLSLSMDDIDVSAEISVSPPADVDVRAIETVSRSEAGFERTPQQIAVLLSWPVTLERGDEFSPTVTLSLSSEAAR